MSNEGLSLPENAAHIGLPVPEKLKEILAQLHNREEKDKVTGTKTEGKDKLPEITKEDDDHAGENRDAFHQ